MLRILKEIRQNETKKDAKILYNKKPKKQRKLIECFISLNYN